MLVRDSMHGGLGRLLGSLMARGHGAHEANKSRINQYRVYMVVEHECDPRFRTFELVFARSPRRASF